MLIYANIPTGTNFHRPATEIAKRLPYKKLSPVQVILIVFAFLFTVYMLGAYAIKVSSRGSGFPTIWDLRFGMGFFILLVILFLYYSLKKPKSKVD